mgnify:CR=1 FL=1
MGVGEASIQSPQLLPSRYAPSASPKTGLRVGLRAATKWRWRACLHGSCFKFGSSPTQMCYGRYGLSRQVLVEIEFKVSFRPP